MANANAQFRRDSAWLSVRTSMRNVLLTAFEHSNDFRVCLPRPLQLPVNPISCRFYDGLNSLRLITDVYNAFKETGIYDARFALFNEYASHKLRVKKGCHGSQQVLLKKYDFDEEIDAQSGEVVKVAKRLSKPVRLYQNVFNARCLISNPVPTSSNVLDGFAQPVDDVSLIHQIIGAVVTRDGIKVLFSRDQVAPAFDQKKRTLMISHPSLYSTNGGFFYEMLHYLMIANLNLYSRTEVDAEVSGAIAALLFFNHLLVDYRCPVNLDPILERLNALEMTECFFHAIEAEQAFRRVVLAGGQYPFVKQIHTQVASAIAQDFFLFSKSESEGLTAQSVATLQQSESMKINF
ncbi:hypothetical protein VIBNISOn1_190005 [Vibrio nigripulchritudo SOn1]|uniref:Uncharacterized protein n=1 Tax=Vibrio nigripulchritudo SOn1 TaxID=1238450 RepID=A0AAV2VQ44_9VIBR|nr:ssDNA-binding domain-containing protein [Vibrio nigripulchritudo]CCO46786.1 hypothetical protein VIBNISOn1_190005 [Vibrio nigripulchritudo SOn1]